VKSAVVGPSIDSRPVSKAAKRERQRLNREARRQIELATEKRQKRLRTARNLLIVLAPIIVIFVILQLRGGSDDGDDKQASTPRRTFSSPPAMTIDPTKTYTATIDTTEGTIVVGLDAAAAPTGVNNFVFLAREKFYDGLTFHRVAKDFVIQTGDPKGDGSGGPGYQITDEVPANGYAVGSVAYAKAGDEPAGTAGSQFFIVTSPAPAPGQGLDALNQQPYQYGALGTVTEGLEVAQQIGALAPASGDGEPTKAVKVRTIRIAESGGESTTTVPAASTAPPG
jgi:cyclophilin family peptidyl-prolyl cis-trans isomerase